MMGKREEEVRQTITEWNDHFANNRVKEYFEFLSDDVTLFITTAPYRIEGRKNDQEEFEYSLEQGWTTVGYFQMLQIDIRVYGDTAVATYHTRGSYGADPHVVYVKETNVLVYEDGRWKIVHIHVSRV
jgi:ketosteroid isomerase-like protein